MRRLLNAMLYFPERGLMPAPFQDVWLETDDGERLHAWKVASRLPAIGTVLLCHGNGGNIGGRIQALQLLAGAGFDVLAFDYRGYGRSSGRPSEAGTYLDARAARAALAGPVMYLGESLGAAVALELALAFPPAALVMQSPFTSVRDMARVHYPALPPALVPDAYPSLRRIRGLRAPLLVLHGDRDEVVPLEQGQALFAAAPEPKCLHVLRGHGHNDLVSPEWAGAIGKFWSKTLSGS